MAVSFKVEDVNISAIRDRAMFDSFANNQSYVIKGIGDELSVDYSAQSFQVTLGSGEAVICGGSMVSEGTPDLLTLGSNETGYICIEVDLAQTGTNICRFVNVAELTQENINDGSSMVYDFPLYQYTTTENGVQNMNDVRNISSSANGVIEINTNSFNSLPQNVSNANITSDHVVVNSVLSNPSAQTSDWNVETQTGKLTISGSISGSTTLTLYLAKKRN